MHKLLPIYIQYITCMLSILYRSLNIDLVLPQLGLPPSILFPFL
jgi:hypothetical protein